MGTRFQPYEGTVSWSAEQRRWVIQVSNPGGGSKIMARSFFQAPVLADHLQHQGVLHALAMTEADGYACFVWRRGGGNLSGFKKGLLKVLRRHYAQFKGRPVNWTLS